ncbi:MAG: hypothetical protein ACI4GV_05095 [Acutalibacteraceae bacterium]
MDNQKIEKVIRPNCPYCLSDNVAWILWGRPSWNDKLEKKLEHKEYVLGGYIISKESERWECNSCGKRFGKIIYPNPIRRSTKIYKVAAQAVFNEKSISQSKICGCYYCRKLFSPSDIKDWISDIGKEKTALCPNCSMDNVIGDGSGFSVTEDLLDEMYNYFYGTGDKDTKTQ